MITETRYVAPDEEEDIRNSFGFASVDCYVNTPVLNGEIGRLGNITYVTEPHDPAIEARRREIQTRLHAKIVSDAERAECAIMGHRAQLRSNYRPKECIYCGTKI